MLSNMSTFPSLTRRRIGARAAAAIDRRRAPRPRRSVTPGPGVRERDARPESGQDAEFATLYKAWTAPRESARRSPAGRQGHPHAEQFFGYDIGAPKKLTYYDDM